MLGACYCPASACLLIDTAVIVDCGLLMALFVPLLANLNALTSLLLLRAS
jgi:hypothetical protein